MHYPEEDEKQPQEDPTENQPLMLDGTANLEYPEDEQIPRVRGLIELLQQYFGGGSRHFL